MVNAVPAVWPPIGRLLVFVTEKWCREAGATTLEYGLPLIAVPPRVMAMLSVPVIVGV